MFTKYMDVLRAWRAIRVGGVFAGLALAPSVLASTVFVNEIHYDNFGADVGEGIEVAGPGGTDLSGWKIVLYNGGTGGEYGTFTFPDASDDPEQSIIPDQQNGFGTLSIQFDSIQNGPPDGVALVEKSGSLVQFLSYEGAFIADGGAADGQMSSDIGVSESQATPVAFSLQLGGVGASYEDFAWVSAAAPESFGAVNATQTFVPVPAAMPLLASALGGLGILASRRRRAPWCGGRT